MADAPTFAWLAGVMALAGLVYGFAGFGAALIWMPLAGLAVGPQHAVVLLSVAAFGSFVTVVPDAWRKADRRAALVTLAAAMAAVPLGVAILRRSDPEVLRWIVSGVVLATLAALLSGWRYHGRPGWPAWIGVGAAVGIAGGSTGLNGPPMVLFQLGGQDAPERSRANTVAVLSMTSLAMLPSLAAQGLIGPGDVATGLGLMPVYALAGWAGRRLFTPGRAWLYRRVAYMVVAAAGILGLPIHG